MKNLIHSIIFLVVVFAVAMFAACETARGAPIQDASTANVNVQSVDAAVLTDVQFAESVKADLVRDMPSLQLAVRGEKTRHARHERRFEFVPSLYSDWVSDIESPPNENAFNGFANVRAREKV